MKYILLFILGIITVYLPAQVKTNQPLVLKGDTSERQVSGVALPNDSSSAVNVNSVAYTYLQYYEVTGTNQLSFNTVVPFGVYSEGMTFIIKSSGSNTDSVSININGLGEKRVLNVSGKKLKYHDIQAGNLHKIIYRGNDFMLISDVDEGCPNGFVDVNNTYCIEPVEHAATLYFTATKTCYDMNARLCTWGEWYNACKKAGLGLVTPTNNYEFIDDAHDHGSFVGLAGGAGSCENFSSLNSLTALRTYRCCYRK